MSFFNSSDRQTKNGQGDRFNHRRFMPWYDDKADYNTNAKSYYDYLARFNKYLDAIEDAINKLLRRRVSVKDTDTVDMTQEGDWEDQDVTTLSAVVNLSSQTHDKPNAITVDKGENGGLYAKDFTGDINQLYDDVKNINNHLTKIDNQITNLNNKVDKIINNLIDNGGWTGDPDNGNITPNMHIAYGNINHYGGVQGGKSFIKTQKSDTTENSTTGGI